MPFESRYQCCSSCVVPQLCVASRRCLSPDPMTKLATEQHNLALNTQPSSLKFGLFIILLPDEAIALKQLLENQFIHPEVVGGS